jgi:hypothetical protein
VSLTDSAQHKIFAYDYLAETISLANKIKGGASPSDISDEMSKIDSLKQESDSLMSKSNQTRP